MGIEFLFNKSDMAYAHDTWLKMCLHCASNNLQDFILGNIT
jgi:hypothetical protein